MASNYKSGTWNCLCDACGFKRKSDELRKRWDGYMVCADTCWEPRHPLDFIRSGAERVGVPWSRPEPTDTFVSGPTCTIEGRQSITGQGTAGCATVGLTIVF